ncbi:hypothetical protein ANCDUO_22826, partial [Ancylostoma duodenale]
SEQKQATEVCAVLGYSVKESDDSTRRPQKEPSQLIQRSVLLRYGDTDPLVIFSAHSHHGNITIILASYGYMMRRLFCRLFDDQKQEILPAAQSVVFPEFTVRCPASESARFAAVSLNADDDVPVVEMHSIEPASSKNLKLSGKQHFFSVCMAPLWGNAPKWLMLIEFVEYYLLQGAEHFFIYKQHVDELTMTVLDKYIREGVVDVVEVNEATNCLKRHRCRHEMQLQVEGMGVHQVLRFTSPATVFLVPPEEAVVR